MGSGTRRTGVRALYIAALLLPDSRNPINKPIVVHRRLVMNAETEVVESIADWTSGKFGEIAN